MFIDVSESSLQQVLNLIGVFRFLSGQKINMSIIKMIRIRKKILQQMLTCACSLNRDTNLFTLPGIEFDVLLNVPVHNYPKTLIKVDEKLLPGKKS